MGCAAQHMGSGIPLDVLVDITSSLYTLVHPFATVLLLVDRDGERLATAVRLRIDERHLELVWVVCERVGTTHTCRAGADDENAFLLLQLWHCAGEDGG